MERGSDSRGGSNAGLHPLAFVNTTELFCIVFYEIFEGEKRDNEIRVSRKFENQQFWTTEYM